MNEENPYMADVPDWKLERFLLNELGEPEMEEIRRALAMDERLRARMDALAESNSDILRQYPRDWMGRQIRERLGQELVAGRVGRRKSRRWFTAGKLVPAGLLAAIAVAVFLLPNRTPPTNPKAPDGVRLKGATTQLLLYRKTASGSEELKDGDLAAAHDLVLIQYQTTDRGYGVILSVDGRGVVTRHLPQHGNQAVRIDPGRVQSLDYAYELDEAPYWERFYLVACDSAFSTEWVIRALEESLSVSDRDSTSSRYVTLPQAFGLPAGFSVTTFTLFKEERDDG